MYHIKKNEIELLSNELLNLGLSLRDFSILRDIKSDSFNIIESKGDTFLVFYLDEKGVKNYECELNSFDDAGNYLKELIKHLKY